MPWSRVASDHPYVKTNAALAELRQAPEKLGRTIASDKVNNDRDVPGWLSARSGGSEGSEVGQFPAIISP